MKKTVFLFLFFTINLYSQCFDCAKNYGGWTGDAVFDLKKSTDNAIYLIKNSGIIKHDSNCNIIWGKNLSSLGLGIHKMTLDSNGNIYCLFSYGYGIAGVPAVGPYYLDGMTIYRGLNLIKFNASGNVLWNRWVGDRVAPTLIDIFNINNELYITGSFYDNISINNQISFNFPYTDHPRAFIAKYDYDGNLIAANNYGNGNDDFISSEIDTSGNVYLSKQNANYGTNYARSAIDKIGANLQTIWTKEISNNNNNNSIYIPTKLYYNPDNNKLYLWGAFNTTVNVLGNYFTINGNNSIFQSLLSEFNPLDGMLERIKRYDNNSSASLPGVYGSLNGNTGFITHKGNDLYILSNFSGTMSFPNTNISSSTSSLSYLYREDLVLFKVNLSDFSPFFILKSFSPLNNPYGYNHDLAGPLLFNDNDLFLTSTFQSKPISINNKLINNNSGNGNSDVMFFKYNINNTQNHGEIIVNNTCLNELTNFGISGSFDSITWGFGDPTSPNNTSTIQNPFHLFTSPGSYHITVTVTCGTNSETIEKDVFISNSPSINPITPFVECETNSGSGISNRFDTSNLNNILIGNQQNTTVEYRNSNGLLLTNPLPNPYTNTNIGGDIITAKVYFSNNPYCFKETQIQFNIKNKPINPSLSSPQDFCIQQNATLNNIAITGQNIKWYDAQTGGNLLPTNTLLQNATTYYASQTNTNCESNRVPVSITIYNTPSPTANSNQSFCSTANATLSDIAISGTGVKWYDAQTGGNLLPANTIIQNATTYYATQTINGCESVNRLPIIVTLINTLNATDFSDYLCDDLNNGYEKIDLTSYNSSLISNTTGNTFSFYKSFLGAQNQTPSEKINNENDYQLNVGTSAIYVRIDNVNTCHQIVELNLTLYSKPIIPIAEVTPICQGSSITINAGNFDKYQWSTGEPSSSILVTQAGNYSVTVTENHIGINCNSSKDFKVVNSNVATISQIITNDWTVNENSITIVVTTSSVGDYQYSLDGNNYQNSNVFTDLNSGEYNVYIRDKNGCGTISEEVFLLMYPKFFTPNGDGFNDKWKIKFSNTEPSLLIKLFDRYGKFIKELDYNSDGWNGTFNGKELPSTDYWFLITRENGKEYKGHFSLKR